MYNRIFIEIANYLNDYLLTYLLKNLSAFLQLRSCTCE